jgi:hypothetical protein
VRDDGLDRHLARNFAVCFSAHSVGQHIQFQRGLNLITVFVVFSDAPKIGARAGLNAQEGPRSGGCSSKLIPKRTGIQLV